MKRIIYKGLYNIFLTLSNRFNNCFLTKCKLFLGTSLLLLTTNSCNEPDEPEIMCYDAGPPEATEQTTASTPSSSTEKEIDFMNT